MDELLKSLGFTAGSVFLLSFLAYLGRQFFQNILKTVAAADLERIQQQNQLDLQKIKTQYETELQERRSALDREIERLKSALSVEVETYRVAAQERFKCLITLWEKSEALLTDTDFSKPKEIQANHKKVREAVKELNRKSVLLSPDTTKDVRKYLGEIETVLTNSEEEFESGETNTKIPVTLSFFIFSVTVDLDLGSIVKSASKFLEKRRLEKALEARNTLETALRREFGVQVSGMVAVSLRSPTTEVQAPMSSGTYSEQH